MTRSKACHTFEICEWLNDVVKDEQSDRTSMYYGINQLFKIYRARKSWLDDNDLVLLSRGRAAMVFSVRSLAAKADPPIALGAPDPFR